MMNRVLVILLIFTGCFTMSCKNDKNTVQESNAVSQEEINDNLLKIESDESLPLIDRVSVDSPTLSARIDSSGFDAKVVYLGTRDYNGVTDSVKLKFFMWNGTNLRGYYHPISLGKDVPFFGLRKGNDFALKTSSPNNPSEDNINITGQFIEDKIELKFNKGIVNDEGFMQLRSTERGYPIIFYETKIIEDMK